VKETITREREGPIQRAIFAYLTKWDTGTVRGMANAAYKANLTIIHIKSVQRAVKRLIEAGKIVETPFRYHNGEKLYSLPKRPPKQPPKRKPSGRAKPLTVVK
jgi:hypothetical protein